MCHVSICFQWSCTLHAIFRGLFRVSAFVGIWSHESRIWISTSHVNVSQTDGQVRMTDKLTDFKIYRQADRLTNRHEQTDKNKCPVVHTGYMLFGHCGVYFCLSVCVFICLSVCLSGCLTVCFPAFPSFCLSVSACLSVFLTVCLPVFCLSASFSVFLPLCHPVSWSVHLSVSLSIFRPV